MMRSAMKSLNPELKDPQDPLKVLDFFRESVEAVNEKDYGDCMRAWNHDLLELKDHLRATSPWALRKID